MDVQAHAHYVRSVVRAFEPPSSKTISEWADENRVLTSEHAAITGRWRTSRAEYLRGPMDAICDPTIQDVVLMGCSQHGKTELILNACGYYAENDPCPILIVQPTLPMAEAFSKDRLSLMFRDTESLAGMVEERSRESANTILHKQFPGGHITIAGANSPASLASRPIRIVFCDEVDRYGPSAGAEGDAVDLAFKRAKTFWNRKRVLTSSPTRTNSRIDRAWKASDQRYYFVACPHCGEFQRLFWNPLSEDPKVSSRVRWEGDDPTTAHYHCTDCDAPWDEVERAEAIQYGEWRATNPSTTGRRVAAGFWIGGLYLPWQSVEELVASWISARDSNNIEQKRVFVNTEIAAPFDDIGEKIDHESLKARAEQIVGVPDEVLFTTCGVDVQGDRLELELVGWGDREESWSLDYKVIVGDPSTDAPWNDLDKYLLDKKPSAVCVDSGGHHTQQVYAFCTRRFRRRVYAIKGRAGQGKIVWPRLPSIGKGGAKVWLIGVDTIKDQLFANLRKGTPGPGYCHVPTGREQWWYEGMTSETVVERYSKGVPIREYHVRAGFTRNEPLDCRVYAYAALSSFGTIVWGNVAKRAAAKRVRGMAAEVQGSAGASADTTLSHAHTQSEPHSAEHATPPAASPAAQPAQNDTQAAQSVGAQVDPSRGPLSPKTQSTRPTRPSHWSTAPRMNGWIKKW